MKALSFIGRYAVFACALQLSACYLETPSSPSIASTVLADLILDPDPLVRRTAAEALGKIGDPSAESWLIAALQDTEPAVREAAALALGRLPSLSEAGARGIAALLQDRAVAVRTAAAQAFGEADVPQGSTIEAVTRLLSDPDAGVRRAAAQSLFGIDGGGRQAMHALIERSKDADASVRRWAVASLAESGDADAVPTVIDRLLHDDDEGVRIEAAYRLRFLEEGAVSAAMRGAVHAEEGSALKRWLDASRKSFTKPSGSD